MAQTPKKFLDANGLTYFASLLNEYPTNVVLQTVINAIDQVKADKTDIVNSDWNATSGTAAILNKPTIPAAQVNSDWNATSGVAQILNKPTIPAAQVNSDWNATSGIAQILNKPTIPSWALAANKPTYTASEVGATTTSDVNSLIASAISGINSFDVAIVSSLPTTNIKEHTIYFISNSSSGNNVYNEYMYINSNWELIGSTQIDLSNYAEINYVNTAIAAIEIPTAELDANVESMLDSFSLDYTSNSSSLNIWQGGSY